MSETFQWKESGRSIEEARIEPEWSPDWIQERFVALLQCQDGGCGEIVSLSGNAEHIINHDPDDGPEFERAFRPLHASPALQIFPLSDRYPESVRTELKKAFALYWTDPGAAANRLRTATEALLTQQRVPRTALSKKNRRVRLPLQSRLDKYQDKNGSKAFLTAIKWLGNSGSHDGDTMTHEDVLTGFELFEQVLERVFIKRHAQLNKIANSITRRKGRPVSRKKRRSKLT